MKVTDSIARRLYLRIWLAVAGSVLVLSLLIGWGWHAAEQERERDRQAGQPREVLVRNAAGELIGTAEAQPRRLPGQGFEFVVTLRDGDNLVAHSLLQSTLQRVRDLRAPMVRVDTLTDGMEAAKIMIPHDGHPNAFTNEMVARAVSRNLNLP